jgi:uncharacterized membrane protein YfcA
VAPLGDALVLFGAAVLAGGVNAIAGGGSLITFPTLVWLGREPICANATNTVSLSPGSLAALFALRRELTGLGDWVVWGSVPSVVGGGLGALLLLRTPPLLFARLVPWLVAFATAVFALSGRTPVRRAGRAAPNPARPGALLYQLAVSVYGGYFGAGIGIMMLAGLGLAGLTAIHGMLALRNFYATCINAVAALYFAARGAVDWRDAAVLTAGQVTGGFAGARLARSLPPAGVRGAVVAIGAAMAVSLLARG